MAERPEKGWQPYADPADPAPVEFPPRRVGPLLSAEELDGLRFDAEVGSTITTREFRALLAHIDAQDATIANQNAEMDRLNGEVERLAASNERLVAEVRRLPIDLAQRLGAVEGRPVVRTTHNPTWVYADDVPLIAEILRPAQEGP